MKTLFLALIAMVAATFAYAQSQYRIQAGDTLQIEVLEDPSLNRSVLVLPNGTITVPAKGKVMVPFGSTRTERFRDGSSSTSI